MEALSIIEHRRSTPKLEGPPPDREDIEGILRGAVRAPNHHLSEPWRFIVLKGSGLDGLGDAMAERVRGQNPDDPNIDHRLEVERSRPHRAPAIIVLVYKPSTNPKVIEVEDRYSVGAAGENILLGASARGFGTYWRTGPAAEDPNVRRFLGLTEGEEIAGFIYIGRVPEGEDPELCRRTDPSELTSWVGWD